MIINIPLQIDEATFEEKVRDDYAENVRQLLLAKVDTVLKERDNRYYRMERDPKIGLESMIYETLNSFIEDHKAEIIEAAADNLGKRLARTKKAKEILEETK